ncbi:alpha/beta hydrolase family protein [Marinomonas sp. 2405UD68-3]|uniref:alpha/beta hydrolase family protein n=1 Tax=Marinomonas sp. 2405UD68-3 TaxID=3391835 RepID=UPI0039C9EC0E
MNRHLLNSIWMGVIVSLSVCCSTVVMASQIAIEHVGFYQEEVERHSYRPLNVTLWYPTNEHSPIDKIADNVAFVGTDVIKGASIVEGKLPVVLLSHGYRGSWRNLNWLATELARDGYLVAAVDHAGTTTFNHQAELASQWWERPKDIQRLLTWLMTEEQWSQSIDQSNVSGIGHSLGGWTVMQLAGAELDRKQLHQECLAHPNPRVCGLMPELGLDTKQSAEPIHIQFKDKRIQKVISLDLGLARGFSRSSLSRVNTPTLILAAGVDIGDLPYQEESGFLAEYIPESMHRFIVYQDATHFSFMQVCKPGAIEILEDEYPGDGIICQYGGVRSRMALHNVMLEDIRTFLSTPF